MEVQILDGFILCGEIKVGYEEEGIDVFVEVYPHYKPMIFIDG